MKYTQLRSFHYVAHTGSFTAAAKMLNISQPTVTEQVQDLEATYKVELFNRYKRKVQLTIIGRSLYEITQRLFGVVNETEAFLKAAHDHGAGQLRISSVMPFFIVEVLSLFRRHHPQVKVSVSAGNSAATLKSLLTYQADIGILSDHDPDPQLYTRVHSSHSIVAIVSPGHPWASRDSISLQELHGQPMVLREVGSNTRRIFETTMATAGVTPKVVMEIEGGEAVREAVAAGHGIGVYGSLSLPSDQRLKALPFEDVDMRLIRYLACLKERREESLVKAFFEAAGQDVDAPKK
jgi:LysR family transcriptional regulator, low CO2-responsive transcriptional regulator